MKKILVLGSLLVMFLFLVSCAPQEPLTDEELKAELAKLTPEEREELLKDLEAKEGGALAGQAYARKIANSAYARKVSPTAVRRIAVTPSTQVKLVVNKLSVVGTVKAIEQHFEVCVDLVGNVTSVYSGSPDQVSALEGVVGVGQPVTGRYRYTLGVADSHNAPNVGRYIYHAPPNGISVEIENVTFSTDPAKGTSEFGVWNDFELISTKGPQYPDLLSLRSDGNIVNYTTQFPLSPPELIMLGLEDPTSKALSSDSLLTKPPVLAQWKQDGQGLNIYFYETPLYHHYYHRIGVEVTSMEPCNSLSAASAQKAGVVIPLK